MADLIRDCPPKPTPRLFEKVQKAKAADALWRAVCREVDERDRFHCRACQRRLTRTLAAIPARLERHHVVPVSRGGQDTTANVCQLCLECHTRRHVSRELEIRGVANGVLTFTRAGRTWTSEPPMFDVL